MDVVEKKVIYIAGRISGVPDYKANFAEVAALLKGMGFAVLNPAELPPALGNARAMKVCLEMIDQADAVFFAPGWTGSVGAQLEMAYCKYTGKQAVTKLADLEVIL